MRRSSRAAYCPADAVAARRSQDDGPVELASEVEQHRLVPQLLCELAIALAGRAGRPVPRPRNFVSGRRIRDEGVPCPSEGDAGQLSHCRREREGEGAQVERAPKAAAAARP